MAAREKQNPEKEAKLWFRRNPPVVPAYQHLIFSTIAPQLAVLFTNPFDTAKVRLQLQKKKKGTPAIYKNSFDALVKIYRNEGITGLQKGLVPAVLREGSKNVFRIGLFDPLLRFMHTPSTPNEKPPVWKRVVAGAASGAMGAFACNPFELIKTRMQAFANSPAIAVGHQHQYNGFVHAGIQIVSNEGVKSLYRGASINMVRSIFGSGTNLASYSWMRDYLITNNYMSNNSFTDAFCGMVSSFFTAAVMNPIDVIRTRIYNQMNNAGAEYASALDGMIKLARNEGPTAFFKGFLASFLRLGPHFTLTFVFFEQLKRLSLNKSSQREEQEYQTRVSDLFRSYDADLDGIITTNDLTRMMEDAFPYSDVPHIIRNEYQAMIDKNVAEVVKCADDTNLTLNQFIALTPKIQQLVHESEVRAAFMLWDPNGEGSVGRNELFQVLKKIRPPIGLDATREETDALIEEEVNGVFERVDVDHDGAISYDDFLRVCSTRFAGRHARTLVSAMMHDQGVDIM